MNVHLQSGSEGECRLREPNDGQFPGLTALNSFLSWFRPVGSGKTALMLALCQALREKLNIACVTNDIFTREDTEFLQRNGALPAERIRAIETGGCPHAAIREDISANLHALEQLQAEFSTQLLLIESGGDNLAANYSRELADYIIYGESVCHFTPR